MEWVELKSLLDKLEDTRRPAQITDAIRKAKRAIYFDGNFGDFIRMVILKDAGVQPKLNVVPPSKRILLDPFLDEANQCFLEGGFNHRNDIDMFEAYCSPLSDKYGKYLDEMSVQQRKVIAMMNEDMIVYRRKKRAAFGSSQQNIEADTIEGALDDSIRKTIHEKGSHTTKR